MKKVIPVILALLMLASVFAACAPTASPNDTTANTEGTAEVTTTPESAEDTTDLEPTEETTSGEPGEEPTGTTTGGQVNKPDTKEPPYEFSIAGHEYYYDNPRLALEKELMDVYHKFEDDNNVVLKMVPLPAEIAEAYATSQQTKVKIADFVYTAEENWAPAALQGLLRPLNTAEVRATGFNTSDPQMFDQFYTPLMKLYPEKNADIWGVNFSGKYFISNLGYSYLFNKKVLQAYGYSSADMYKLVDKGEWTWQKFIDICKTVTEKKDSKGNPLTWGATMLHGESELASNTVAMMNYNATTKRWVSSMNRPELQASVYFFFSCSLDGNVAIPDKMITGGSQERRQLFYDGKAAFIAVPGSWFGKDGINAQAKDPYGVLPIPMGGPGTNTIFGPQHGVAQEQGKNLPTKGYIHVITHLKGYTLQAINGDWKKACGLMAKLGDLLTDPKAEDNLLLTYYRGDKEALRIIKTYLKPAATISVRYSPGIAEAIKSAEELIVQKNGDVSAFIGSHDMLQAAIDKTFGYK